MLSPAKWIYSLLMGIGFINPNPINVAKVSPPGLTVPVCTKRLGSDIKKLLSKARGYKIIAVNVGLARSRSVLLSFTE